MKYSKFLVFFLGMLVLGCQKETTTITSIYIDENLEPYLERFQQEGAARGVTIDFAAANVSAYLEYIQAANVTGQCYSQDDEPNRLVIDQTFWEQATDIRREFVVFHELGHCYLRRSHLDITLPDGSCASMMHSGLSGCRNAYNSQTRSDYLDELFLEE
jgi:hypothetical protein